ncbi:MAG: nucleotidyltransferase domain-containing protein [Candidatus Colwellbacteria bacterium]|nr:nucleotidyltransferase domain-containing protein [Candidatus Colwellbacteria bacterium]
MRLSFFVMPLGELKKEAVRRSLTLFNSVPFVRLVVLSGSCAKGTAREESDIDIIIGADEGRVWTARFFSLLFADARGVRNKGGWSMDMLCMSLFVSRSEFRMSDPENDYERELYPYLYPVYGEEDAISDFASANKGLVSDGFISRRDIFLGYMKDSTAKLIERVLSGGFGDAMERFFRRFQTTRISRHMADISVGHHRMRIILSPSRVETHFRVDLG